jgi:hypothetical protein
MEKLYVLAIRPKRRPDDITITDEMEDFIREQAGHEFLISPYWWKPPPLTKPETLPLLCTERVMRTLMLKELEDATPDRIMHCAEWDPADERKWRRIARQKSPLPHGEGVFPWERVMFSVTEAERDAHDLLDAFTRDPWAMEGGIVRVTPEDAIVLMMLHPPGSFEFIGPESDCEWLEFESVEEFMAAICDGDESED